MLSFETPGAHEPELLPIGIADEDSTLRYLRDQYNAVKMRSKELGKLKTTGATPSDEASSKKAVLKLYSAM